MENRKKIFDLWHQLYPEMPEKLLENFLLGMDVYRYLNITDNQQNDWYKDAVVYSIYVDLFNVDLNGLRDKLNYLDDLGVSCIWLLPVLESPMRDAGFDISDYMSIRKDLKGEVFMQFLKEARQRGIKVIFDIAINHTSEAHHWFVEAMKSPDNPYRNYYIWSNNTEHYKDARIIFKGIETSNWEPCGDAYFFHRFFNFQPDLNYKNPEVLFSMCRNLAFWQHAGVDGFRADAIPYLWKEEGTSCENLPKTHTVVKFFRALLDYIKPGTLLLAEACQKPDEVVAYLGDGDECHAAYHFPLMPRIFKSIAMQSGQPIQDTLSPDFTPKLPGNGQWFTFLRCHDELSLELVYVTEDERKYIHENYCHQPSWDFRMGEGISARLAELMQMDARKILLAYSVILTLPGTPVIYYGDEFAKGNDIAYYNEMIAHTGKDDTRFLVRGKINWKKLETDLADEDSLSSKVYEKLKMMLKTRRLEGIFGRGSLRFIQIQSDSNGGLMAFIREFKNKKMFILHNMTDRAIRAELPAEAQAGTEVLHNTISETIEAYGFRWIRL